MLPLIYILASIALFAGFLLLTKREAKRCVRFFPNTRADLDLRVSRVVEAASNKDLGASVATMIRHGVDRLLHDVAHLTLIAVRSIERLLTRAVRSLRTKRAENAPASPFVSTMTDFKRDLRNEVRAEETSPEQQ